MDIIESLKTIHKTLDENDHYIHMKMNGRQWNALNIAIDRVAAELGYEFRADGMVVCVKPEREEV
jgi:hypothetical protein